MLDETTFRSAADSALESLLKHLIDREAVSGDFEVEEQAGVIHVLFEEPAGRFVITPNAPVRQIWISALSTSFKMDWIEAAHEFQFPRTGEAIIPLLDRLIDEQRAC